MIKKEILKTETEKLRNCLSIKERQEILNNGCAGMRSLLFYLDTLANKIDAVYGSTQQKASIGKKAM